MGALRAGTFERGALARRPGVMYSNRSWINSRSLFTHPCFDSKDDVYPVINSKLWC